MSTLTKILIVLLTISSIFLCGIVVTYVANADNYRDQYNTLKGEADGLRETEAGAVKARNEKEAEMARLEDKLNSQIASLEVDLGKLQTQLKNTERRKDELLDRVSSLSSAAETYSQTAGEHVQLLKDARDELKKVDTERIQIHAQLEETSATLLEKMAIIQTLEIEKRRLLEGKSELQSTLDKLLLPTGKLPAEPVIVTPEKDIARPAPVTTKKIGLKGLVTGVDLKNKLAGISIGTADGVKEGMKFHVTRGDKFICDILIIDTDAEEAVGALELMQEQPKAGDVVSTEL